MAVDSSPGAPCAEEAVREVRCCSGSEGRPFLAAPAPEPAMAAERGRLIPARPFAFMAVVIAVVRAWNAAGVSCEKNVVGVVACGMWHVAWSS